MHLSKSSPQHPLSLSLRKFLVLLVKGGKKGDGGCLILSLDFQNSAFIIFAEMVLSSLIDASQPRKFLEGYSCMSKHSYQDVLLNAILSLRVRVYSSLINIKPSFPDDC